MSGKDVFLPVLLIVIGWLLNELGQWIRFRREDRRILGEVLADLLEVRHNLVFFDTITEKVFSEMRTIGMPAELEPGIKKIMKEMICALVDMEALRKRYQDSVTRVAGLDPYLAFQLRPQANLQKLPDFLVSITKDQNDANSFLNSLEGQILFPQHRKGLDRVIWKLARGHGIRTSVKIWLYLRKPSECPPEMNDMIQQVKAIILQSAASSEAVKQNG